MAGLQDVKTGVREIDAGTEGLRYLLQRIFEPMVECRRAAGGCDRTRCSRIQAIITYLGHNFDRQERLMDAGGYPHEDHHRRDHWRLIERLRHMYGANVCADEDATVVREVINRWAADHVPECDRRLGRWAVTRRVVEPTDLRDVAAP
ncbi:hypothetical protein [Magnetospirillum sp. UT-4]|uniref:hypothetical protein n=1 Tax=Magnetospirillum sp. UT-4 TaxID=2681467 RepID=UPI001380A64E|nr:hypothetical protein [Magnetospirillum sp. UT-4]CAA7612069.1 conserved hypothetical protein [Magnetospirillum sp. UT-4]